MSVVLNDSSSSTSILETEPVAPLSFLPWEQPHFSRWGYDARSAYCERFWLPVLGPSCMWLGRNIAYGFDAEPAGYSIDPQVQAALVGLRPAALRRCLQRLAGFGLAHQRTTAEWIVRTSWAPIGPRALKHLPTALIAEHRDWEVAADQQFATERDERAIWRFTLRMHATGVGVPEIDAALRVAACDAYLRRELVEWARTTPRYGPGARVEGVR